MSKGKIGIGTIEINKKFADFEEASRYAKRLRQYISYVCKKKEYQASVITVVSNTKKGVSDLRNVSNGKRGRPRKELVIYDKNANGWYKGNYHTDYHIHVLIVSKPSFALRNHIKDYIDKNWIKIPNIHEKEIDNNNLKKKVYKKECNIKIADYFIDQSSEIRFVNCNYSGEEDFKYSLKDYYSEYLKLKSARKRLNKKHRLNLISQESYENKLMALDIKFKAIEDYFYSITKEQEEKAKKDYIRKRQLGIITNNCNKVQNISIRDRFKESYY